MKKLILIIAALFAFTALAIPTEAGLGISPGCYGVASDGGCMKENATIGKPLEFRFNVFNYGPAGAEFKASADTGFADRVTIEPEKFTVGHFDQSAKHRECIPSDGCQVITVKINTTDMEVGEHQTYILVSTTASTGGAMSVIEQVGARILLDMHEPEPFKEFIGQITGAFTGFFKKITPQQKVELLISLIIIFTATGIFAVLKKFNIQLTIKQKPEARRRSRIYKRRNKRLFKLR